MDDLLTACAILFIVCLLVLLIIYTTRPHPMDFPKARTIPMPPCKPLRDYVCKHALWRNSCIECDADDWYNKEILNNAT